MMRTVNAYGLYLVQILNGCAGKQLAGDIDPLGLGALWMLDKTNQLFRGNSAQISGILGIGSQAHNLGQMEDRKSVV